jgi:hypothetical protein
MLVGSGDPVLRSFEGLPLSVDEQDLCKFESFVTQARRLRRARLKGVPTRRFETFTRRSICTLAQPSSTRREQLGQAFRLLGWWSTEHDLLSASGYPFKEDHFTKLMRWALEPNVHRPSALARQFNWLERLGIHVKQRRSVMPHLQPLTEDGIPDLVLDYPKDVVVVEAKVGSVEHDAPSGRPQTRAYVAAAKKRFDPDGRKRHHLIFLTTDRSEARNRRAVNTTFGEFALAQAEIMRHRQMTQDTRVAFAMIITYFLAAGTPPAINCRRYLEDAQGWSERVMDGLVYVQEKQALDQLMRVLGIGAEG